jgi:hypothetical protein
MGLKALKLGQFRDTTGKTRRWCHRPECGLRASTRAARNQGSWEGRPSRCWRDGLWPMESPAQARSLGASPGRDQWPRRAWRRESGDGSPLGGAKSPVPTSPVCCSGVPRSSTSGSGSSSGYGTNWSAWPAARGASTPGTAIPALCVTSSREPPSGMGPRRTWLGSAPLWRDRSRDHRTPGALRRFGSWRAMWVDHGATHASVQAQAPQADPRCVQLGPASACRRRPAPTTAPCGSARARPRHSPSHRRRRQ